MKVLVQRVQRAEVRVGGAVVGAIGAGLLVLLGVERDDDENEARALADKTVDLRIFPDDRGRMNRSVRECGFGALVVSQFTLAGSTRRGRRPSFAGAAEPAVAKPLYEAYVGQVRARDVRVATGVFGAMMEVESVNDGPVTLLLDPATGRGTSS